MLEFGNHQIEVLPTRCCDEYKALIFIGKLAGKLYHQYDVAQRLQRITTTVMR